MLSPFSRKQDSTAVTLLFVSNVMQVWGLHPGFGDRQPRSHPALQQRSLTGNLCAVLLVE